MIESYNDYLYRKRKEAGLRRKQVASALGVSMFMYHRFERGYSAPSEEVIKKISDLYGEDFHEHFDGEAGYPAEIKDKGEHAIRQKLKEFYSKLWVRLTFVFLSIAGLACIPASIAIDYANNPAANDFYSQHYEDLQQYTNEYGQPYINPIGNFNQKILPAVYAEDGYSIYCAVKAPIHTENLSDMDFTFIYRVEDETNRSSRYAFRINYSRGTNFTYTVTDNETGEYIVQTGKRVSREESVIYSTRSYGLDWILEGSAFDFESVDLIAVLGDYYFTDMFNLPDMNLGGEDVVVDFFDDILTVKEKGDAIVRKYNIAFSIVAYLGVPIGIMMVVLTILSYVFLNDREVAYTYIEKGDEPLPPNKRLPLFMGASALRIIGSTVLLLGSTYVLLSLANQFGMINMVLTRINGDLLISFASNIFFLGVFFLYILGLSDDFGHPARLYRRTIMFGGIALVISTIQSFFAWQMKYLENGFVDVLLQYLPSNIFVPVFLFHVCALFLFSTPFFVKGKGVKVWRACSLLPVIFSTVVFVLDIVNRVQSGDGIERLSYFIGINRFPYVIATYCFLFGNFFLRKHYSKRYGSAYLRGDLYALRKNLTLCVPALLLGAVELILNFNLPARTLGFGTSYSLLFVAVLMLFYRGHNDKHHVWAAVLSRTIYTVGLVVTYAMTILLAYLYLAL
ncbi:MAG: helix-turn-helix domain-containing protein [Bacilli bacterium]|nr:helix-turn-helix domain-containing protein [Bacilli bacterium]